MKKKPKDGHNNSSWGFIVMLLQRQIFLALFFFLPTFALCAEPVILQEGQEKYPLGKYLQILEDPSGQLTLEEVTSPEFSQKFVASEEEIPNFGFTNSTYWVRFAVENRSPETDWLLEVAHPYGDYAELYIPLAGGGFQKKAGGERLPFHVRELKHHDFVFQLHNLSTQPQQFYYRILGLDGLLLPLTIWSKDAFFKNDHEQQYFWGIYYGMMLVMVVYNLLLFVGIRHRAYLFYSCYILTFITFQMSINGLAYEYLWPDFPEWSVRSWPFLMGLTLSWAILFTQSFLKTAHYAPLLHKILYGFLALQIVSMVFLLFHYDTTSIEFAVFVAVPNSLLFISAGALCLKRGYRPARYYLLGWIFLVAGGVAIALKAFGVLPSTFLTEHGMQIGSALEVILLSLALADRLNTLEGEKLMSERDYRVLVENLNVGVFRINYNALGTISKSNRAALKIFGYDPSVNVESIEGPQMYQNAEDHQQVLKTIQEKGEIKNWEVPAKRLDGRAIWISLSASAYRDKEGKIQWVDSIVEDITQRKEDEAKIKRLNATFEKFVPQQFLKRIAREGIDQIELGKAQTEALSILFADIRAFTQFSETINPQEVLDFLNTYLREVNQPIQNYHGFIDKFMGDGIMALFDRPTHATNSFHSSLAMVQATQNFNEKRAKKHLPPISIGIAIHSGNATIGTVGTEERMDSTVLGDTVNLASRMESLTKYYNAQIIISSDTHEAIQDASLLCRELDFIAVKGKSIPKTIFEVFNGNEASILEKKQKILPCYMEGLAKYRIRHWKEAVALFKECLTLYPEDLVSQMYIERCHRFQENPPDDTWQGEIRMDQSQFETASSSPPPPPRKS